MSCTHEGRRALCNHWKESKKSDKWTKFYSLNVQSISTLQSSLIPHSILCGHVIAVRPLDWVRPLQGFSYNDKKTRANRSKFMINLFDNLWNIFEGLSQKTSLLITWLSEHFDCYPNLKLSNNQLWTKRSLPRTTLWIFRLENIFSKRYVITW